MNKNPMTGPTLTIILISKLYNVCDFKTYTAMDSRPDATYLSVGQNTYLESSHPKVPHHSPLALLELV